MPGLLSRALQRPTKIVPHTEANSLTEAELFHEQSIIVDNLREHSSVIVKGRLRSNLTFWENIGASSWVLDIIRNGYCLPFLGQPEKKFSNNHSSATNNADFVTKELQKLVSTGAIVEVPKPDLTVCNPLGVVQNSSGKLRLILDLRYVNKHLRVIKFKYEDIRTACDLFSRGDWFFKFDYKSGYHHIDIFPEHTKFLGCTWLFNGQLRYFKICGSPIWLGKCAIFVHKNPESLSQALEVPGYQDFYLLGRWRRCRVKL